ncbi:Dak1-domain-containing protein [Aureobasidium pullulans]|uniref:Dak1-domain-containing protein n=1 Tax=Aureobasidium pullulans TaxID=5580 RepID=A0A4S9EG04_AURPU|nr:Dak1-domain-containing protein [Aureobasidium pullulans]THX33069.1 Dak1-domain-containing protein [Aureobasidium pullulans]
MATKHFFPSTDHIVVRGLESLVAKNPHLSLDPANKVVFLPSHSSQKVSVISGGGAGHEPAWCGYVGSGLLSAAVSGEVFASPSTKQIMAAVEKVPSDKGVILCITNYTGDNLHFGLAREKISGSGRKVGMLRMTDDVGLGREKTKKLGRRGLAGNMFVLKLCGAAAEEDYDFDTCFAIGESVNGHCVTIGSSLDYCHIPGRTHHESLPANTLSVAQGIHNEAGLHEKEIPPPDELIQELLRYLLDENDKDRAFVKFTPEDEAALLINNFGGLSNLELEALTSLTISHLKSDWNISPSRVYAQPFETSLNAPGFSISLLNISGVARETKMEEDTLYALLDRDTNAPAWPRNSYGQVRVDSPTQTRASLAHHETVSFGPKLDVATLEGALRSACEAAVAAEPDITKWDIVMGDGDCGEAVEGMCKGVLSQLSSGLVSRHNGALLPILDEIESGIEEIGGTLGAIISILLASWTSDLKNTYRADSSLKFDEHVAGRSAGQALKNLQTYTPARVGGRTVMDTLIPFCETLSEQGDMRAAVTEAVKGADKTEGMPAVYGRATYVGDKISEKDVPRDPGAYAASVFLQGLWDGLKDKL